MAPKLDRKKNVTSFNRERKKTSEEETGRGGSGNHSGRTVKRKTMKSTKKAPKGKGKGMRGVRT